MKVFVGESNGEYVEVKPDGRGSVDLSIRTSVEKKTLVVTAKLDSDSLDKVIANLILLKSKVMVDER
jgi:hypothetical protein